MSMSLPARALRAVLALACLIWAAYSWQTLPMPDVSGMLLDGIPVSNVGHAFGLASLLLVISVFFEPEEFAQYANASENVK
jgi:hypothetical protein